MEPEAGTIPALLARRSGRRRRTAGPRHARRGADLRRARRHERRPGGPARGRRRRSRATGSACWRPTGSNGRSSALAVMRIGAVLVPLSTLLRPPELLAQLHHGHRVAPRRRRRSSAAARYLDELEGGRSGTPRRTRRRNAPPGGPVAAPGLDHRRAPRRRSAGRLGAARWSNACGRPTTWSSCSPRGARGTPKGVIHTHGAAPACGRVGPRRPLRGSGRAPLHPDAVLLDRRVRRRAADRAGRRRHPADRGRARTGVARSSSSQRERVTLFRGWPDQAARLAAQPDFATADLSSLRDGSLRRRPSSRAAPGPRGPGQPLRHDRDLRSLLRRPPRPDLPPGKFGSCGRPFDGVEIRIVDPDIGRVVPAGEHGRDPRPRRPPDAGHLRAGPIRRSSTPDGFYRDRRPGPARCRRLPLVLGPPRRHGQGQGRHRLSL